MTETMSEMRAKVKKHIEESIDSATFVVVQHRPWTIVAFVSSLPNGEEIQLMGASKVCHPDLWDEAEGRLKAVDRAIAWEVRAYIAPAVEVHDEDA